MRSVVAAGAGPAGVRAAAGAGDGERVLAGHRRPDDPVAACRQPDRPALADRVGWRACPKLLVWDGESAVGRNQGGKSVLTSYFAALAGLLGVRVRICRPADPEAKGLVERANGYLETSFLPGRVFSSPGDFNAQLVQWLERANRRWHRRLEARPAERRGR